MPKPLSRRTLLQSTAASAVLLTPASLAGCVKTGATPPVPGTQPDALLALIEAWGAHFGYYDGRIDLEAGGDLRAFVTADCTLTAHAPLWGTKEGEEEGVPAQEVRGELARMLKWTRIARHDMHMARHSSEDTVALFFVVKARMVGLPFTLMRVPLVFVVTTARTDEGLRIQEVHEWPAASPEAAQAVLVEQCGWPAETTMAPHVAFGAAS